MAIEKVTKYVANGKEFSTLEEAEKEESMGRLKTIYESNPLNVSEDGWDTPLNVSEDGWDTYDVPFDEMVEWIQHNTKLIEDILYNIK